MDPTVGRSVHFFPVAGGTPLHAVITRVFSPTCVNLDVSVINTEHPETPEYLTSVCLCDNPSQAYVWDWPEIMYPEIDPNDPRLPPAKLVGPDGSEPPGPPECAKADGI